jgi:fatty acid desaturase
MLPLGFSWGAFFVYVVALIIVVLGGFWGLVESQHPAFLAPILMGLFFFYLCWEAVVEDPDDAPPAPPASKNHG